MGSFRKVTGPERPRAENAPPKSEGRPCGRPSSESRERPWLRFIARSGRRLGRHDTEARIAQPLHDKHGRESGIRDFETLFAEQVGQGVNGVTAHPAPPAAAV